MDPWPVVYQIRFDQESLLSIFFKNQWKNLSWIINSLKSFKDLKLTAILFWKIPKKLEPGVLTKLITSHHLVLPQAVFDAFSPLLRICLEIPLAAKQWILQGTNRAIHKMGQAQPRRSTIRPKFLNCLWIYKSTAHKHIRLTNRVQ